MEKPPRYLELMDHSAIAIDRYSRFFIQPVVALDCDGLPIPPESRAEIGTVSTEPTEADDPNVSIWFVYGEDPSGKVDLLAEMQHRMVAQGFANGLAGRQMVARKFLATCDRVMQALFGIAVVDTPLADPVFLDAVLRSGDMEHQVINEMIETGLVPLDAGVSPCRVSAQDVGLLVADV